MNMSGMARVWRVSFVVLLAGAMAVAAAVAQRFAPSRLEPRYEGRRLGHWLRGHPREYGPAVEAVGTNALPYLLGELQITDPAWVRWAEHQLGDFGTPWEPARARRYHAQIALQVLDTNAVPALLNAVFARPMCLAEGDRGYEAAFALTWMASPAAQEAIRERVGAAMRAPDAATRRNACLAVAAGNWRGSDVASPVAALTRDRDPAVRAAAVRAAMFSCLDESVILPAVIERLADEQACIRWLAAEALRGRGTNAVTALPALRAAWSAELARPRGEGGLDDVYSWAPPPARMREALREAMRAIDAKAALPAELRRVQNALP